MEALENRITEVWENSASDVLVLVGRLSKKCFVIDLDVRTDKAAFVLDGESYDKAKNWLAENRFRKIQGNNFMNEDDNSVPCQAAYNDRAALASKTPIIFGSEAPTHKVEVGRVPTNQLFGRAIYNSSEAKDKTAIVQILLSQGWTADEIFSALYDENP